MLSNAQISKYIFTKTIAIGQVFQYNIVNNDNVIATFMPYGRPRGDEKGDTMPVTLKDLSQRCGLSVSAVSKALNNYSDISEQTRSQVRSVAMEMGYFPNAQARALKTNRSYNIGVVYEDGNNYGLMHYFFTFVLNSFKREVEANGYDITFINHNIGKRELSFLNHCRYRGMDGALIACVDFLHPDVKELASSELPVVTIDHEFPDCPCVMSDNRAGIQDLVKFAVQKGHRRIAYIYGDPSVVTEGRVKGFRDIMNELGLPIAPEYMVAGLYHNTNACYQAVEQLLALPEPPSCILMTDDYAAFGGLDAIRKAGLFTPEDVSVAGYDGIQISQLAYPRLTTIAQDTDRLGYEAARLLIERIEQPHRPVPAPVMVPCKLIEGQTIC